MRSSRFLPVGLFVVVLVGTSALALQVRPNPAPPPASPSAKPARPNRPALSPSYYSAAAESLRRGDLQSSRQILRQVAEERPSEAANSRLLEGLYAHERGRTELAEELLAGTSQPGGPLEDWRLLLLAESAEANGHELVAREALARLTAEHPESPLLPPSEESLPEAAEVSARGPAMGDFHVFEAGALDWERLLSVDPSRRPGSLLTQEELATALAAVDLQSAAERRQSVEELRRLYEDFREAGLSTQAMDALRSLRRLDPWDTTGARDLWERGWTEYRRGDAADAVSYWTELAEIYPEQSDAQRGRYWKARALESLGAPEQARETYRDLLAASDTTDFYHRQALAELGAEPAAPASTRLAGAPGPWPRDPALRRAKLLTDLGLDGLAEREIEIVQDQADARDLLALRGLVRSRRGDLRGSMGMLRRAYPALGGPNQGKVPAEILLAYYPVRYAEAIRAAARDQGLPPYLVAGIIRQESSFDPLATSPAGASGLMQLMPETAREAAGKLGVSPWTPSRLRDPEVNVRLGAAYFRRVLDDFDGNVELALAGYNGGPNRIGRLWREAGGREARLDEFLENLGIEESRDYVKRILVLSDSYRQLHPDLG